VARILLGIWLGFSLALAAGPASVSASSGGRYFPLTPARILDTRIGLGAQAGRVQGGTTLDLTVVGNGAVPAGATAVVLNITVTGSSAAGYLTVFSAGGTAPLASNLNFTAGQTVPNLVEVGLSPSGVTCTRTGCA